MNKRIKNLVRLVSIALLLLIVPIAFVGCGGDNEPENPTGYIGTFQSKTTFDYNRVFASVDNSALLFDDSNKVWLAQESEIAEYTQPPFDVIFEPRTSNGIAYFTAEINTEAHIPVPDVCKADIDPAWIAYSGQGELQTLEIDRIENDEIILPIPDQETTNGTIILGIPYGDNYYFTIYILVGNQDENDNFVSVTGTADNCSWTDSNSFWLAYIETTREYSFVKTNDTTAELTITLSNDTTNIQVKYALSKVGEYWKLGSHTTSGLPFIIPLYEITFDENGQGTFGTAAPAGTGGNYDTAFATQIIEYSVSGKTLAFTVAGQTVNGTFSNNFTKLTLTLGNESVTFDKAL